MARMRAMPASEAYDAAMQRGVPLANRIAAIIAHRGDATVQEIADELAMNGIGSVFPSTITAKCAALRRAGYICLSGRERQNREGEAEVGFMTNPSAPADTGEVRACVSAGTVDVRLYRRLTLLSKALAPTANGLNIPRAHLPALIDALEVVQAMGADSFIVEANQWAA